MKCPKDGSALEFRSPRKTKRAGMDVLRLRCPECKELYLATDKPNSHPYQTHPHRLGELDQTKVYAIRLSPRMITDFRNGKAVFTIDGDSLQLQYKT